MDVVGYVRVSTAEQADSGLGLAAQAQAIRTAVAARGDRLVAVCEDAGVSGKGINRPGLDQALAAVEAGDAQALVVAKLDRLSRSIVDFVGLMDRAQRKGWHVVALDLGVDTRTPQGEMVANVMASFAQFERRIIGQRTKDALAIKRQQGVKLGRPRSLPEETVQRIRRMRDKGATLKAIADRLNTDGVSTAQGGRCWYPATVRKVLMT
jgi:DNA invertase Pin-like site-specific DNA recombinase